MKETGASAEYLDAPYEAALLPSTGFKFVSRSPLTI